jgi:tRNA-dihydrouridine synthase B
LSPIRQREYTSGQPRAGSITKLKPLKPLHLGDVSIGFPIVQAALSGYSDWPMRTLAREHGARYTLHEVMLDQFLVTIRENRKKTCNFLHIGDGDHPVGGQLMGAEPEQFSAGAAKLVEAGFDVIDINFGCPVKKVLGRCRGGFHLSQPQIALEIIRRTRDVVPDHIPVTVKMRRGIDDSQQSRDHFFEIIDGAFQAGVDGVTVHGRTVEQRYIGPSRWEFLTEVKRHVGAKIILGSGDLFSAQDCLDMIEQTGIDGVTVARGAIGNPWIFRQAEALASGLPLPPPPTIWEQRSVIERHLDLAEQLHGEKRAALTLRKFGVKYAASHPRHNEVKLRLVRAATRVHWLEVLDQFYTDDGPGQYPSAEIHRVQGEC